MLIHEFRVILPLTVQEYQIGQLYSTAEMSKCETGGQEGVEVVKNEPFKDVPLLGGTYNTGQYSQKIYHLEHKAPTLIKLIVPHDALKLHEESWNAYPYSKTVLTNPGYMKENFELIIESIHLEDRGDKENALQLPPQLLQKREVTVIDIANDPIMCKDYDPALDPKKFKSQKTGRGPLSGDWIKTTSPVMTCYKLVRVNFKWFGLQGKVERFFINFQQRLFTVFHRRVFCSTDHWYGLNLADIRRIEEETKEVLDRERIQGCLKGVTAGGSGKVLAQQ